jgi:membrane protein required for colicin V production
LNWADWTILAILAVSCLISLVRGFVREALSLLVWGLASFVAITFHERLDAVFARWISTPSIRSLLAFVVLFVITLIIGSLITRLLHSLVEVSGLGGLDRLLGMVFGAARGLLLVLALVILLPILLPVQKDSWWQQSKLIPHFEAMEGWSKDTFHQLMGWGRALSNKALPNKEPDTIDPKPAAP